MIWAIRQILVPGNYLRISHGASLLQSKAVFDFVLPIIFTSVTVVVCLWLDIPLVIFKHTILLSRLEGLLALMIVFYMAALAAVATYDKQGIDDKLKGTDAVLMVRDHRQGGMRVPRILTYRQFVSYLFGYLSFLSLCIYIVVIFMSSGWPRLEEKVIADWSVDGRIFGWGLDPIIFALLFFSIWQLVFTSFLGIYFLTERIQSLNSPEN